MIGGDGQRTGRAASIAAAIRRLARVGAALFFLGGCSGLRGLELKNHCATNLDCAAGRVCVAGTCRADPDVDSAATADSALDVTETAKRDADDATADGGDADVSDVRNLSGVSDPSDASDRNAVKDVNDASDVNPVGDANDTNEVGDANDANNLDDVNDASDVSDVNDANDVDDVSDLSGLSMDPCRADPAASVPRSRAELAPRLVGSWQLCSNPVAPTEVSWLAGSSGKLQLTSTGWLPLVDNDAGIGGAGPQGGGDYYFLLEASEQVVHFMGDSAGVDVAVSISAAGDLISFRLCEGVTACAGPVVARFLSMSQKGGGDAKVP